MLRQITVNDLPVGRDVDETLRLVQAFKFTDEHGEVCPAGWRKGKKTMKPTKEGVSQYLATQMKNGMEHYQIQFIVSLLEVVFKHLHLEKEILQ